MSDSTLPPGGISRRRILGAGTAMLIGAPLVMTGFVRPARAAVARLHAGPMPGHATQRSARLWFQTATAAEYRLEYWVAGERGRRQLTPVGRVSAENGYCGQVLLRGLQPGTSYEYRLLLDGEETTDMPLTMATHGPYPGRDRELRDVTILAGSCAWIHDEARGEAAPDDGRYRIFGTMAEQRADAMLWLGDNVYFRSSGGHYAEFHRDGMDLRYRNSRGLPELQPFLRGATRHYATWDDHDFGPNNTGREWMYKDTSVALFKRYWANPSYGIPGVPGVFSVVPVADADIFLLDGRYHRDDQHLRGVPDKQMLGAEQIRWLQNALLQSRARFKLVCSGSGVLSNWNLDAGSWNATPEGWRNYPGERARFMDWLAANDVRGVVFMSGDRHFTELLRQPREGHYPLYEITTSPLTSGPPDTLGNEAENPLVVTGTIHARRNFTRIDITGANAERALRIRQLGTDGDLLWERRIMASEIGA